MDTQMIKANVTTEIKVSDVDCIKILRLQPGDVLVVDPTKVYRMAALQAAFRVPIVLADPEAFMVVRQ